MTRFIPPSCTLMALLLFTVSPCIHAAEIARFDDGPFAGMGYPFSESARAGDLLFLAGQIGEDADGKLVPGGIQAEARQMLLNIEAALARRGLNMEHVVKCTVFLADIAEWGAFNEVYKEHFSQPYPARSALGARGLAGNARVEMECIAAYPNGYQGSSSADDKHPEYDAVMRVVELFFEAVNTSDAALMTRIALHDSMTYSVREGDDGHWSLRARPQTYDMDPANWGPEKFTERYWSPTVLIADHIAVFWAPYDFYIDGKFSHCGIDAIDLVKVDGEWKLGNSSWTVQKTGCVLHPDGPPPEAE